MSVLSRARLASLSVLLLAGTALVQGASPAVAADPVSELRPTPDRSPSTTPDSSTRRRARRPSTCRPPAPRRRTRRSSSSTIPVAVVDVNVSLSSVAHPARRPRPPPGRTTGSGRRADVGRRRRERRGRTAGSTFDDEFDRAMPDDDPFDVHRTASSEPTDHDDGPDAFPAPAPRTPTPRPLLGAFDGTIRRRDLEPVRRRRLRTASRARSLGGGSRSQLAVDGLPVRAAGLRHRAGHRRGRVAPRLRHRVRPRTSPSCWSVRADSRPLLLERRRRRQQRGRHGARTCASTTRRRSGSRSSIALESTSYQPTSYEDHAG